MRYTIAGVVGLALLGSALLVAPAAVAEEAGPATLKELGAALTDLARRLDKLRIEAGKDPDQRTIEEYMALKPEQLKVKRRRLRAELIVGFMVDPSKNFKVRLAAQTAIIESAQFRGDPDFSLSDKQGGKSKRAYFCDKHLVPHLKHDDAKSRKLVNELLKKLWSVNGIGQIREYNVNIKRTWKPAISAWKKYLKRQ